MNLLKKVLKNGSEIMNGLKNSLIKTEHVEEIASERMEICKKCEFNSENTPSTGPGFHCSVCKCNLGLKTHSLASSCPKGYWDAIVDNDTEQIIEKELNLNFDDYETT